jgi:hypothetical protein
MDRETAKIAADPLPPKLFGDGESGAGPAEEVGD